MNILVIGSGAVGSIIAGVLSMKGFHVDLACKSAKEADLITSDGLVFKIKQRKYIQFLNAYDGVKNTSGNYDYALLATKAFDMMQPAEEALAKLKPDGLLVSLQDGFCEEQLSKISGSERLAGCVIGWGATLNDEGAAIMTSPGDQLIGKLDGKDDPRLDNLQYLLNHVAHTSVVGNIKEQLFSKLIINSCVTTLGAITGLKVGALITNTRLRNIFLQVIKEAILIADIMKIDIPDYAGKINYYRLIKGDNLYYRARKHLYIRLFGLRYRRVKSSGLQSLERGEKTEVDYLNGYLLNKAKELGVEVTYNKRLVEILKEIENGKRKISPKNMEDPLFRIQ